MTQQNIPVYQHILQDNSIIYIKGTIFEELRILCYWLAMIFIFLFTLETYNSKQYTPHDIIAQNCLPNLNVL